MPHIQHTYSDFIRLLEKFVSGATADEWALLWTMKKISVAEVLKRQDKWINLPNVSSEVAWTPKIIA